MSQKYVPNPKSKKPNNPNPKKLFCPNPDCEHVWIYKGYSKFYVTCPQCHNKVKIGNAVQYITEDELEDNLKKVNSK